ncbi:MAG: ATP-binding protein [Gemmatimonadetes bacterium]|nr:ATP-binding protein [Gemmatimonadota bacterium]
MKRIVVTGSECTGKSTLARQLAAWLKVPSLPEAARAVAEALPRPLTADDVGTIASRHMAQEDTLVQRARPALVVLDTDLVSTVVYAHHYYGACDAWITEEAVARRADLYLWCAPDLPWQADGVRDRPAARAELHSAFGERLHAMGARVLPVDGVGPLRLQRAMAAVRGWRAAVPV